MVKKKRERRGRPKLRARDRKVQVIAYLPREVRAAYRKAARLARVSLSYLVGKTLEAYAPGGPRSQRFNPEDVRAASTPKAPEPAASRGESGNAPEGES
jgi:hypothetical protein